jgi:hypothetical protein
MSADPDPVVAALPDERPAALARMSPEDRGRCARYFFIARGSGMDEMLAWFFTMQSSAEAVAEARAVVANMEDEAILAVAASLPDDDEGRATFWRLGTA